MEFINFGFSQLYSQKDIKLFYLPPHTFYLKNQYISITRKHDTIIDNVSKQLLPV